MHILIIPSERLLPVDDPFAGIFQYHQALALPRAGIKVGIVALAPRFGRNLSALFCILLAWTVPQSWTPASRRSK